MSVTNIVRAVVKPGSDYTVTSPIMKEDKGQVLLIEGLDLPEVYEIDFSNDRHHGSSITMIGNADGVLIPTQFIKTGRDVFAFYYYVGDGFGQTEHIFRLPNDYRPEVWKFRTTHLLPLLIFKALLTRGLFYIYERR